MTFRNCICFALAHRLLFFCFKSGAELCHGSVVRPSCVRLHPSGVPNWVPLNGPTSVDVQISSAKALTTKSSKCKQVGSAPEELVKPVSRSLLICVHLQYGTAAAMLNSEERVTKFCFTGSTGNAFFSACVGPCSTGCPAHRLMSATKRPSDR